MGKKGTKRKISQTEVEELEDQRENDELDAEMAALIEMRSEKQNEQISELWESEESSGTKLPGGGLPYQKDGLLRCLESMGTTVLPFVETLHICEYNVSIVDANDDIEREVNWNFPLFPIIMWSYYIKTLPSQMAFYNHSVQVAKDAQTRLIALGIPTRRPTDYFCENVKTDAHMTRVRCPTPAEGYSFSFVQF